MLWDVDNSLTTSQNNVKAIQILDNSSRFINSFCWLTSVFINFGLIRDLILQLINPIQKRENAINIVVLCGVILSLIFSLFIINVPSLSTENRSMLVLYSSTINGFYLSSIVSVPTALYLMGNLGMGKKTKRLVLSRHIAVLFIYWVCNLYVLFCIWNLELGHDINVNPGKTWPFDMMLSLFFSQGWILPLFRMIEPGSFKMHRSLMSSLIRRLKCQKRQEDEVEVEHIDILLDSTLNVEFVYVILEGIVKFSKKTFAMDISVDSDNHFFEACDDDVQLTVH